MKARIPHQGGGSQANMMKKIQEMQDEMARVQAEVEAGEYTSSAGGGAVEAKVNGAHELLDITLKPEIVDPEEIEILADMIISAVNGANRKAADTMEQAMSRVTGGLNIPGLG